MARKVRHSALESRGARLKLQVRRKPYPGPSLARGVSLLYRRNRTNGAWVVKASNGHGAYWTKRLADADDYAEANGKEVLTFFQARMDLRERFATNLRRLRNDKGWSQEDLALEAKISPSYLSQLEKGVYYVSIKVIGRLAEKLDVEPEEFLKRPTRRVRTKSG